jgi:hypothetical protein
MSVLQVLIISGITNIVFLLLVLFSCRCVAPFKITGKLLKHKGFRRFYDLHCYYWWGFIISVLVHTITAFIIF